MVQEIALVTGGNRGIGFEVCRQLARRGMRVILTSRREAEGREAAARLRGEGLDVLSFPLDVASSESITALRKEAEQAWKRLDVLVNNAGVALHGFNARVARTTLDINFFGAVEVTESLLPFIPRGGRVVMVSSGSGELSGLPQALRKKLEDPALTREALRELMRSFVEDVAAGVHTQRGWPSSAYQVSKAGLNAFSRLLAREQEAAGVLVNAVCPGWVRTDMGGPGATRSVEEGADTIVWASTLPADGPTGGFFRDRRPIPW